MVVNAHTSGWRKFRRRESPVSEPQPTATVDGPDVADHDLLWRACLRLPADHRTAVVLRFYEQLEYAEMAELTGVREGTVRSRVSRGAGCAPAELGEDR